MTAIDSGRRTKRIAVMQCSLMIKNGDKKFFGEIQTQIN